MAGNSFKNQLLFDESVTESVNMKFVLKLILFAGFVVLIQGQNNSYDYKNQALWYDLGAECQLNRQSPIELNKFQATPGFFLSLFKLRNFDTPLSMPATLLNNGHTANLELPSNNTAHIYGGPLYLNKYKTQSLHFHWGSMDFHGCEHIVDSHRCSMELHIVHRNSKYATLNEATQHPDGLCVLAVLFDVDPNQQQDFNGLNSIVNALPQIVSYNSSTELQNFRLLDLLGDIDIQKFFTYEGSLTTPPCSQAVTWIVFTQRITISPQQINRFRSLEDENQDILVNNYRFLQARNNRPVFTHY